MRKLILHPAAELVRDEREREARLDGAQRLALARLIFAVRKNRHDAVADEFDDLAARREDRLAGALQILVEQRGDLQPPKGAPKWW